MTNQLLRIWGAILLIPALPTLAFYLLFSHQNYFELQDTARGIVATGPIAAYIALVWTAWSIYRRVSTITDDVSPLQSKVLGDWKFEATSFHGSQRRGNCQITEDHGRLSVTGTFERDAKPVGQWNSTMANIDREQFQVLYRLDELRDGVSIASTAVLSVHINPKELKSMSGTWVVLGKSEENGEVVLTRPS